MTANLASSELLNSCAVLNNSKNLSYLHWLRHLLLKQYKCGIDLQHYHQVTCLEAQEYLLLPLNLGIILLAKKY